jgi:peptidoglycan/xylan/chitin deacetylase (PgdA/CDA1 family)
MRKKSYQGVERIHKLTMTFDVEDFINQNAIFALGRILLMLNKYRLRSIFFVTGHMAEKLGHFPEILSLLREHEIGFHSSSHSVRPTIPEYADTESYEKAYEISRLRETSHVNPLTGKVEGEGGIYALQDIFRPKRIISFRAPGMSWTPPHLEALRDLGVEFDFSSSISLSETFKYRGMNFYPYTFIQHWEGMQLDYKSLVSALLKRKIAVFDLHPTLCVNQRMWDSIYHRGNPESLTRVPERAPKEADKLFRRFELFLRQILFLQKLKLIRIDSELNMSTRDLTLSKNRIRVLYEESMRWPKRYFNFTPRFAYGHFQEFFERACQ